MPKRTSNTLKTLTIKEIVKSPLLYSKIRTLMEQQKSYAYIIKYLNTKGYTISKASLTNLKKKVEEATDNNIPIAALGDKREKPSIDDIPESNLVGFTGKSEVVKTTGKAIPIYSEDQVLERIIQKGFRSIEEAEFVDPNVLMKALDMHAKYFGNKTRGLTSEGLKQYQLIMQAETSALRQVFFQYIPKEKQEEALKAMEKETKKVLSQIGVTKEGKELLKQLQNVGLPVD